MAKIKAIPTPERMWELFEMYIKDAKSRPLLVHDFVGKDGEEVFRQKERPLTLEGFECFVMDHTEITYPDLTHYFEGRGNYAAFVPVCTRIRRHIRQDQIAGGMAGIYNPSITQRLNNLSEKVDNHTDGEVRIKVEYVRPDRQIE